MAQIAKRVFELGTESALDVLLRAKALEATGRKVIHLEVGEPDFPTPAHICEAAVAAMNAGHTHYTAASGILELKQAVAKSYKSRHGLEYAASQVVISNGAKHSLHNLFVGTVDAALAQHRVHQSRFAMINVSNNGDIADIFGF